MQLNLSEIEIVGSSIRFHWSCQHLSRNQNLVAARLTVRTVMCSLPLVRYCTFSISPLRIREGYFDNTNQERTDMHLVAKCRWSKRVNWMTSCQRRWWSVIGRVDLIKVNNCEKSSLVKAIQQLLRWTCQWLNWMVIRITIRDSRSGNGIEQIGVKYRKMKRSE